jgi:hypothetical protein
MKLSALLAAALALSACFGPPNSNPGDGNTCASCKPLPDGGNRPDAGRFDAGTPDAGRTDAGPADAGQPDAGEEDAGEPDSGSLPACPAGSVTFPGKVLDLCESIATGDDVPLDGVLVSTLQPYSQTVTSDGGLYVACIPNGVPTTLVYTRPGYVTSYDAEVVETTPLPSNVKIPTSLACTAGIANYFKELTAFNPNLGMVYIAMASASNQAPCEPPDAGLSGWTFTATLPDGGTGDGGPWPAAYFDSTGTLQSVPATLAGGEAMIFNIDPGVGYVTVQGTNPVIGSQCPTVDAALGFTGRVYVAGGAIDFYPWLMP